MTRSLRVVDAGRPLDVFEALRRALGEGGPAVVPRAAGGSALGRTTLEELSSEERVPQNVALVIETSGSTGAPKRVALSADALLASAAASAGALGGQGQWVLALPAHYVAGAQVLVRSLAAETEPVAYGDGHFEPERFARAATELTHDLRYTSLVPVQLARLVDAVEGGAREVARALRRFDGILVGGQTLDARLRERAEAVGVRILSTYGSSETAGGCVYNGVPIGTTVAREVAGVLEISGPSLAEGYLGDAARTSAAFHEQDGVRWYRTGDLGRVEQGRVTVLGRADNVIISGGEKVLLDAVERVVRELPGFDAAVVVGIENAEWGRVPVVVVGRAGGRASAGESASSTAVGAGATGGAAGTGRGAGREASGDEGRLRAVREQVGRRLGRAAAPARIIMVDAVPRLSSGKPDRLAAARLAEDETRRATGV